MCSLRLSPQELHPGQPGATTSGTVSILVWRANSSESGDYDLAQDSQRIDPYSCGAVKFARRVAMKRDIRKRMNECALATQPDQFFLTATRHPMSRACLRRTSVLSLPAQECRFGELWTFSWSTDSLISLAPYWAPLHVFFLITAGDSTVSTSDVSKILTAAYRKYSQSIPPPLPWCPGC